MRPVTQAPGSRPYFDEHAHAARVVVLSHDLWGQRGGADPRVVGSAVTLDGEPFTVEGVMPEGLAYPAGARLWTPLVPGAGEIAEQPGVWRMSALGRLRPGSSLEQARRDMRALATRYDRERYGEEGATAVLTPLAEAVLGPTRPTLAAAALPARRALRVDPALTLREP